MYAGIHNILTFLFFLTVNECLGGGITPSQNYPFKIELVLDDGYVMFWDHDNKTLTVELHVKTHGYVGWGLSPNGGMRDSDILIGWVNDGRASLYDYYGYEEAVKPTLDSSQDVTLISGHETDTHTVLKFKRDLDTCDSKEDRKITVDTTRLIYSWSDEDPADQNTPMYHGAGRRNTKSVALVDASPNTQTLPSDATSVEFLMSNFTVPEARTTYWCQGFRNPIRSKVHAIQFEPVIQAGNEGLVHHMILYGCTNQIDPAAHGVSWNCVTPNMAGTDISSCTQTLLAWAIGGTSVSLPEHVGLPFEPNSPSFFRLEIHYDNSQRDTGRVDSSGLRLWATNSPRLNEAGVMTVGLNTFSDVYIPPGLPLFRMTTHCRTECLNQAMQDTNTTRVRVFAYGLHTHLLGRALRVRHFRNNVELPLLAADQTYDFNFQESRFLKNEVEILPGDRLVTECDYDSSKRTNVSVGGLETTDEMCLVFLYYYPKISLTDCYSHPYDRALFQAFSLASVPWVTPSGFKLQLHPTGVNNNFATSKQVARFLDWTRNISAEYETITESVETVYYCTHGAVVFPVGRWILENASPVTRWEPQETISPKCQATPPPTTSIPPSSASPVFTYSFITMFLVLMVFNCIPKIV